MIDAGPGMLGREHRSRQHRAHVGVARTARRGIRARRRLPGVFALLQVALGRRQHLRLARAHPEPLGDQGRISCRAGSAATQPAVAFEAKHPCCDSLSSRRTQRQQILDRHQLLPPRRRSHDDERNGADQQHGPATAHGERQRRRSRARRASHWLNSQLASEATIVSRVTMSAEVTMNDADPRVGASVRAPRGCRQFRYAPESRTSPQKKGSKKGFFNRRASASQFAQ